MEWLSEVQADPERLRGVGVLDESGPLRDEARERAQRAHSLFPVLRSGPSGITRVGVLDPVRGSLCLPRIFGQHPWCPRSAAAQADCFRHQVRRPLSEFLAGERERSLHIATSRADRARGGAGGAAINQRPLSNGDATYASAKASPGWTQSCPARHYLGGRQGASA